MKFPPATHFAKVFRLDDLELSATYLAEVMDTVLELARNPVHRP